MTGGLVYPMFMADGWFTQTHLPARLAAAGGARHFTDYIVPLSPNRSMVTFSAS